MFWISGCGVGGVGGVVWVLSGAVIRLAREILLFGTGPWGQVVRRSFGGLPGCERGRPMCDDRGQERVPTVPLYIPSVPWGYIKTLPISHPFISTSARTAPLASSCDG